MVISRRFFSTFTLLLTATIGTCISPLAISNDANNVHLRGVVVPSDKVKMSLPQNGLVTFIAASGTIIEKGQKLVQISETKLLAELNQAKAKLGAAQTELEAAQHGLEKSRRLVKENILSDIALTESEFAVKTAQANVEVNQSKYDLAKLAVEQALLLAPFDGVVADTGISTGEWAKAGDPILEFASLTALNMSIDIPPELTDTLSVGDTTNVTYKGTVIGTARVKRLFPILQPSSGLRRVVWTIESEDSVLISGRYVELQAWF